MTGSKLMLHAGAAEATLAQVDAVPTPEATDTWQPVPHALVVREVKQALAKQHFTVAEETYALWGGGQRMFGVLALQNGQNPSDYGLTIGVRNSHDHTFPAAGAIGSRVFVCDNLAFSGELSFSRKHTKFIQRDLPAIVEVTLKRLFAMRGWQDQRIAAYKDTTLDQATVHDFVVRSIRTGVLPKSALLKVLDEYANPTHEDFQSRTAWSLFNAYTEVGKAAPSAITVRTLGLHNMMDTLCGVKRVEATLVTEKDAEVAEVLADYEVVEEAL